MWRPFWILTGDESYDPTSGSSFSVISYVIDSTVSISPVVMDLCKPQIYGLWTCVWRDSHIKNKEYQGIIVIHKETKEFGVASDYYPFPETFNIKPHMLDRDQFRDVLTHIDKSVAPLTADQESSFYRSFLNNYIPMADALFSTILVEEVGLDNCSSVMTKWAKVLIDDLLEHQEDEYGLRD